MMVRAFPLAAAENPVSNISSFLTVSKVLSHESLMSSSLCRSAGLVAIGLAASAISFEAASLICSCPGSEPPLTARAASICTSGSRAHIRILLICYATPVHDRQRDDLCALHDRVDLDVFIHTVDVAALHPI